MKLSIRSYKTGEVLSSADVDSIKTLVQMAARSRSLDGADLIGVDLSGIIFGMSAKENNGLGSWWAGLRGAKLCGSDLSGCQFFRTDLIEADFSGACLAGSQFYRTPMDRANFFRANLTSTHFHKGEFKDTNFNRADLTGAHFAPNKWGQPNLDGAIVMPRALRKAA